MDVDSINQGLEIVSAAIEDKGQVSAAQQMLRTWFDELGELPNVDPAARSDAQGHLFALIEVLGELHTVDPLLFSRQQGNARGRIEPIRRRLLASLIVRGSKQSAADPNVEH